ncbi:MAG: NYN domain-containing protein [Thermodesulfobacteriota bacterium]
MLLLDGHNLIGRTPGLSLDREDEAREFLLRRIGAARGSGRRQVVVVFDGNRPGSAKEGAFGGLRVVYSPEGRSADEEILRRVARGHRGQATVVTSDRQLAQRALDLGAGVESCESFLSRLERDAAVRRESAPSAAACLAPSEVEAWLQVFRDKHKM